MKKYVCPMHPDVVSDKPGMCPKCHMELEEMAGGTEHKHMDMGREMEKHDHTMAMTSPEMAGDFLRRFFMVTALLIPLVVFSTPAVKYLGIPDFIFRKYLEFGIATAIFYFGLIFFKHAKMEVEMRRYGMMTLVSLGVGVGYLFSAISTFVPALNTEFYLEIATLIWVLLFGHYLEAKSSSAAGDALSEVAKLLPKSAHLKVDKGVRNVGIESLKVGDVVLVKPGEKVPADGKITKGSGNFNEAHLSGESKPVEMGVGKDLPAGAISIDSAVEIKLTRVGDSSTIGQIKGLIENAKGTKPSVQRLADKAAKWLTFSALAVSLAALVFWSLIGGQPLVFAATLAITVLVIACPHALGLAIPTVSTIATRLAVKNGIFIKDLGKIEVARKVDYVIFDKTGTLTLGNFVVTSATSAEVLRLAAAVEQYSEHPIAQAVVGEAKKRKIKIPEATGFRSIAGQGVTGFVGKSKIEVRRPGVSVYKNAKLIGSIEVADEIRSESREAVIELHRLGVKVAILSGDKKEISERVAKELSIDAVFSEVLPEDKYKYVRKLQEEGNVVVMAGDGVNDAPALTQADAGVAIGAGTDVAVEAGDVVLTQSNPEHLVRFIILAKKVYGKMMENLFWAAGYNIIAIPAAAGVFIPFGFRLTPAVGALVMSLSSVIVVANALTLRNARLEL